MALFIWCWIISPPKSYSIGSSAVTIFNSPLSISLKADANVVDLPEPVGPETITIPLEEFIKRSSTKSGIPKITIAKIHPYYLNENTDLIQRAIEK